MYRTDKQFMKNPATAGSRVYIGALSKTVIADDLETKFKTHGNILGLVLNSGFAFIQFEHEYEAQSAIKAENGAMLHGRKIVVKQAMDKSRPGGNQGPPQFGAPPQRQLAPTQGPPPPKQAGPPPPKQGPPQTNQPPKLSNPPPQKTPPPPQSVKQPSPPSPKSNPEPTPKFQPPEQDSEFQDENMDDDRPNIRPPGPPQHDDRGRKRMDRGQDRNKMHRVERGRSRDRDRFIDRYEPPPKMDMPRDMYRDDAYYGRDDRDFMLPASRTGPYPPILDAPPPPEKNDCEIIVVAKALTEYAEFIELKLKTLGLVVDLLFPNEDVPIGKVLANISSRGCLYAILVMPQNEENRSLTLNILHGIPQEHRNMPVEDAMILISRNFESYMKGEHVAPENGTINLSDRHPTAMQMMLNLLAENRQMSSSQYDRLIKYLQDRRELQQEYEIAEGIQGDSQESDPKQAELQSRILNILNKSNDATIPTSITASEPQLASAQNTKTPILKDPTVQKALDSLLSGDMFKNMSANS